MKEFKVLRIIDKFKWIFEKFGVDYKIMRKFFSLNLLWMEEEFQL